MHAVRWSWLSLSVLAAAGLAGCTSGHDYCALGADAGAPPAGPPPYQQLMYPAENPYSVQKAILGKILFWEEQLSSDDTMACGTCHRPAAGGSDPRAAATSLSGNGGGSRHPGRDGMLGTLDDPHGSAGVARCKIGGFGAVERKVDPVFGERPQVTRRKAPSYLDAMFFNDVFWDGRATSEFRDPENPSVVAIASGGALESQVVGPPLNDGEMACESRTWNDVREKLKKVTPLALARRIPPEMAAAICESPTYPRLFEKAFGTPEITAVRIAFAVATHERSLHSSDTPWDRYNRGDLLALTPQQEQGRQVYFGAGLCARCHPAPGFAATAAGQFMNLGFQDPSWDQGRMYVTGLMEDLGKFQPATVRNAGLREAGGLLHDGTGHGATLDALMAAYNTPPSGTGIPFPNTDPRMTIALGLNQTQVTDLVEFVRNGLTDPRVRNETYPFNRPLLASESSP